MTIEKDGVIFLSANIPNLLIDDSALSSQIKLITQCHCEWSEAECSAQQRRRLAIAGI